MFNIKKIRKDLALIKARKLEKEEKRLQRVPMTEEQEYRNAGITKEEARKKCNSSGNSQ